MIILSCCADVQCKSDITKHQRLLLSHHAKSHALVHFIILQTYGASQSSPLVLILPGRRCCWPPLMARGTSGALRTGMLPRFATPHDHRATRPTHQEETWGNLSSEDLAEPSRASDTHFSRQATDLDIFTDSMSKTLRFRSPDPRDLHKGPRKRPRSSLLEVVRSRRAKPGELARAAADLQEDAE